MVGAELRKETGIVRERDAKEAKTVLPSFLRQKDPELRHAFAQM